MKSTKNKNQKLLKTTAQKGDVAQVFYKEWGHNHEILSTCKKSTG